MKKSTKPEGDAFNPYTIAEAESEIRRDTTILIIALIILASVLIGMSLWR